MQLKVTKQLARLFAFAGAFVAFAASAQDPEVPDFSHLEIQPQEIAGTGRYQVPNGYYAQFKYTWFETEKDKDGNIVSQTEHTSTLAEPATHPDQIIAFLTEVYTNPLIPGTREDRSYISPRFKDAAFLSEEGNRDFNIDQEVVNKTSTREQFHIIEYPAQDFAPYFIKEAPQKPLTGATALIVELKDEYKRQPNWTADRPILGWGEDEQLENAVKFIKSISIIPSQHYVPEGETSDNPGFLFNLQAEISKFFIITKGSFRPFKSILQQKKDAQAHRGGKIFFDMFEEFSPANTGPEYNAYAHMNSAKAYEVDHNCSSALDQQHDIVLGPESNRERLYPVNLMFYLPDYRYADYSTKKPSDRLAEGEESETYSVYTYYAKDHRPYVFFNKIAAEIKEEVKKYEQDEQKALVPVTWTSSYKKIVGQKSPESFWVYRVNGGIIEPNPIPLDEIIIRDEQIETTTKNEENGSLVRAQDATVKVYVLEPRVADNAEVTYIIRGTREGADFNHVESNMVEATIPVEGIGIIIDLAAARSTYDMESQKNNYSNTVNVLAPKEHATTSNILTWGDVAPVKGIGTGHKVDQNGKETTENNTSLKENIYETKDGQGHWYHSYFIDNEKTPKFSIYRKDNLEGSESELVATATLTKWERNWWGKGSWDEAAYILTYTVVAESTKKEIGNLVYKALTHTNDAEGNAMGDIKAYDTEILSTLDAREGVAGSFEDIFAVSTANGDHAGRYYYTLQLENPGEAVAARATPKVKSNTVTVGVPVRPLYVGYVPYSRQQIENDTDYENRLPENPMGVAFQVVTNANIAGYTVTNVKTKKIEAEAERATAGSGAFDCIVRHEDGSHTVQKRTVANYQGKLPIELEDALDVGDVFALTVRYVDEETVADSPYAHGNTYGGRFVKMTSRPTVHLRNVKIDHKGASTEVNGHQAYDCTVTVDADSLSVTPAGVDPVEYTVAGYSVWSHVHENYKLNDGFYPEGAVFENIHHFAVSPEIETKRISARSTSWSQGDEELSENAQTASYSFTHARTASQSTPVAITHVGRLYTEAPSSLLVGDEAGSTGYLVADTDGLHGIFSTDPNTPTTGVEDVTDDTDAPIEYYNLQGFRVDGPSSPGVYIKKQGNTTSKFLVK